jgi:hypothetical protein
MMVFDYQIKLFAQRVVICGGGVFTELSIKVSRKYKGFFLSSLYKITGFITISSYCISKVNLCGTALVMGGNLITRDIMIYYYL